MSKLLTRLRQIATVTVSAGALTATIGVVPASASTFYTDTFCGANVAVDGVYTRGCFYEVEDGYGQTAGYRLGSKMRIPSPLDPAKWTSCEVRLALFEKSYSSSTYRRVITVYGDCLAAFKANSQNNTAFRFASNFWYSQPGGSSAYVMVRWFGTYDGQSVGMSASGPFAYSTTITQRITGLPTDSLYTETPAMPDQPGAVFTPDI